MGIKRNIYHGLETFDKETAHIWIKFDEEENIYLIDKREAKVSEQDIKSIDPDRWIEISDEIAMDNTTLSDGVKSVRRKRIIGEMLYKKIQVIEPKKAGKITGMLLEMDNKDLFVLLGEHNKLTDKINEALAVLRHYQGGNSMRYMT